MGNDLKDTFYDAHKVPTGETLEQLRQHYFIQAIMCESDDSSIGGLNINKSGRQNLQTTTKKKEEKSDIDYVLLLQSIDLQIQELEINLMSKYGEDFADNLAAELLDEETYNKLMQIEDPEERRKAIAKAINDGIKNGTIDPSQIDNPDIIDWLNKHDEQEQIVREMTVNNQRDSYEDTVNTKLSSGLDKFM